MGTLEKAKGNPVPGRKRSMCYGKKEADCGHSGKRTAKYRGDTPEHFWKPVPVKEVKEYGKWD